MHAVKCTQCGRSLTIHKPVVQAKIRCPACGAIFVGTSHPVAVAPAASGAATWPPEPPRPDSPNSPQPQGSPEPADALADLAQALADRPPASAAPATPAVAPAPSPVPQPSRSAVPQPPPQAVFAPRPVAPHYVPRKSRKALYLGLLFGFFGLFLIGVIYVLVNFVGKQHVTYEEPNGRVVSAWLTPAQVEEKKQQAIPTPPPPVVLPAPGAASKPALRRGGVNPSLTQAELAAMPPSGESNELPEVTALPPDPKITAMGFEKIMMPGSTDTGTLIGRVVNKYGVPLKDLELTPQIVDPKGRVVARLKPFACSCIPVGGEARYTAKFEGVPEEAIEKVRIAAKVVPMEKGMVCYEVDDPIALDPQEKTVTATGTARNLGVKPMAEAYVQVDFYTREWIFIKSVRGALTDDEAAGRITPGRYSRFKAQLALGDDEDGQRVQKAVARVVGKEE